MMTRKNRTLLMLYLDYLENGEDCGVTSKDLQWKFDYDFNLSRASNLLQQLHSLGYLTRKIERFPSGGKRYNYFLSEKGFKKAFYLFDHTTEDFNKPYFLSKLQA